MTSQQPRARISGTLTPRAPFDFAQTLGFMRRFTPMSGEQRIAGGVLTKAIALDGRAILASVWSEGDAGQPRLAYTLTSETALSEDDHRRLRDRISFFLSLDDDIASFYARAEGDTALAPTIARLSGLHQPKFLTPFEIACWAVLVQRTPMPIARRVKDQLVARYGPALAVDGVAWRAFPEVAALAAADPEELAAIVRNPRKSAYLGAVIELFGAVDEAWLRSAPVAEVEARLRATRGIGAWSAMFILVRGLGRMDAMPTADDELQRATARIYAGGEPLAPAQIAALLTRYGDLTGYWAFYCRNALGESGAGPRQ